MFNESDLAQIRETFLSEAAELAEAMEAGLLGLRDNPADDELINSVFRAAHTIKGSAGLIGLDGVVGFTHLLESVLVQVREHQLAVDEELLSLLLSCQDYMKLLIDIETNDELVLHGHQRHHGEQLSNQLRALLQTGRPVDEPTRQEPCQSIAGDGVRRVENDYWHISLRCSADLFRDGMDPLSCIRYLSRIGEIRALSVVDELIPVSDSFDPESCYLGFEIAFCCDQEKSRIEEAFQFVRQSARIDILPPCSKLEDYQALIAGLPENDLKLGEILTHVGALTARELEEVLQAQQRVHPSQPETPVSNNTPLGELLVAGHRVQKELVDSALAKQQSSRKKEAASIRVDAEKLDHLINLVGELVIASASAGVLARAAADSALIEVQSLTSRLIEQVRDSALNLRMVAIGATFNRFNRVVFDVSRELNKKIHLEISGGDTELDKSMVEKLGDPLLHLIRNAVDHGIEAPELRRQRGKPEQGTLRLHAYHDSGSVVIEVSDDGGGLSRERILHKALEKELIKPGQTLSDEEVWKLIFEPGFSTAAAVSSISGRGVGMDVVKRNIEALRGTIEIESQEEIGTRIRIRLPLTLAIIDGFLVSVGNSQFVVPLEMVVECVDAGQHQGYMNLRDGVLPLVSLREYFSVNEPAPKRENVVVVQAGTTRAGLVVDKLHGEVQTVIKPLATLFQHAKGVSGSTIQGNGEVALILDIPVLIRQAERLQSARHAHPALLASAG